MKVRAMIWLLSRIRSMPERCVRRSKSFLPTRKLSPGHACLLDGDYSYIYSNYIPARRDLIPNPLIVSRIKKADIEVMSLILAAQSKSLEDGSSVASAWVSAGNEKNQNIFLKDAKKPKILFMDGRAPEMSVCRVRGLPGYFCCLHASTYQAHLRAALG
ncbi:MAG: hypothetical protein R3D26_09715 [Cyanobacteriota/Melainabacteria group bacterium]